MPVIFQKTTDDTQIGVFDFTNRLASGEILSSVTNILAYTAADGVTSLSSDLIIGVPSLDTAHLKVSATFQGGRQSQIYELRCKVVTSLGQTLIDLGAYHCDDYSAV